MRPAFSAKESGTDGRYWTRAALEHGEEEWEDEGEGEEIGSEDDMEADEPEEMDAEVFLFLHPDAHFSHMSHTPFPHISEFNSFFGAGRLDGA